MTHKFALLLLPTLSPSLDIIISLCLDLFINFFEELHILNVTLIIFFKTALDFFKILFNPRDLINVKCAKSIDQQRAFLYNFAMHILEFCVSKRFGRRTQTFERRRRRRRWYNYGRRVVHVVVLLFLRRCRVLNRVSGRCVRYGWIGGRKDGWVGGFKSWFH
jgi:hypothetical protein